MRPEFKDMHCPFMRTVLGSQDAPAWDKAAQQMKVEDLVRFVRDQPGNGSLDRVVRYFAVVNHGLGNRAQRLFNLLGAGGTFSTKLVGSDGDHSGDSQIYHSKTREFDAAEFAAFTAFSSDGAKMIVAEIGAAIVDMNHRHGGRPSDALQSAGEYALMGVLLGDDAGSIPVADMRTLFEKNEFPAGAREKLGSRTAEQWFGLTNLISDAVAAAAARAGRGADMHAERLRAGLGLLFGGMR